MSAIKVACLSYDSNLFGSELSILDLFTSLDRSKVSARLLLAKPGPLVQAARNAGLEVCVLPWLNGAPLAAAARLAGWLLRHRIEIVELNRLASFRHVAVVNLAAKLSGCKTIVRLRVACDELSFWRKLTLFGSDLIISVSRQILAPWRRSSLPKALEGRLIVLPNTTDVARLRELPRDPALPRALGIPEGARIVGMVGAITPNKRQDLFLEAAEAILGELPNAWFLIVGRGLNDGYGEYMARLGRLVEGKPLAGRVVYAGYRGDALALMKNFDVLVVPSDREAFARVLIEAMALGVPVVAHRTDGIPDVVDDGATGLLVGRQEPGLYADAALRLLREPNLTRRLTQQALRSVARMDNRGGARAMERIYEGLVRPLSRPS